MGHYTVRYTKAENLEAAGFAELVNIPYIFDTRPGFHRLGSLFLVDRGCGHWSPRESFAEIPPPTPSSLKSYAYWLCNFLEWAERSKIPLEDCEYLSHVYRRYQKNLLEGSWSITGKGLMPSTVNAYVQQACDFLSWMSAKGLRPDFSIPKTTYTRRRGHGATSASRKTTTGEVRKGRVRTPKHHLRMPKLEEVRAFVESVYSGSGQSLGLMAETLLQTGIRRSEAVGFRVDTLPLQMSDWHISNPNTRADDQQVLILIKYGAKGQLYGTDHGDKVGPRRYIKIPLHLARKIHHYRNTLRPRLLAKYVNAVRGVAAQRKRRDESVHLFLNEKNGTRVTYSKFYDAWHSGLLPFVGWSPHSGRDWWACSTLLREVEALQLTPNDAASRLAAFATPFIQLTIQPQLGHKNVETCFIYLQWVADMIGVALPALYQDYLEDENMPFAFSEIVTS